MDDTALTLLKMWYEGKTVNDPEVQSRAPIDIFAAIKIAERLETKIEAIEDQLAAERADLTAALELYRQAEKQHYEYVGIVDAREAKFDAELAAANARARAAEAALELMILCYGYSDTTDEAIQAWRATK
jgi:hypothetical protein